jgi:hypothetical protein
MRSFDTAAGPSYEAGDFVPFVYSMIVPDEFRQKFWRVDELAGFWAARGVRLTSCVFGRPH